MGKLTHDDLFSLEEYAIKRPDFRARVIEHKKDRRVAIGDNASLYFEDRMTMQYQVQEMLRIEKIFESQGIQDELDVYNSLIPDGSNWKATFMLEYKEVDDRRKALSMLIGIERALYAQIEGFDKVRPIANEDLKRETEEKTSAVHFVRFELTAEMIEGLKSGAGLSLGIDHAQYNQSTNLDQGAARESLIGDLD